MTAMRVIAVIDRVGQTAHGAHNRHRAVFQRDHLHQPARLVVARHHDHVGAGIDQVSQLGVEVQFQMAIGTIVEILLEVPELAVDRGIRAWSQQHKLRTVP